MKVWVPVSVVVVIGPTMAASFICVAVVTSLCLTLAPSSAVIVPSVVEMFSPTSLPPWRVVQKDIPPAG